MFGKYGENMNNDKIIEPIGFIAAFVTFIFSLILFYTDNSMFLGSLAAAVMASGLAWSTYIILRWVLLAFRK